MSDDAIDWEAWALAMCTLLDAIDCAACHDESLEHTQDLVRSRFALAADFGVSVRRAGPASGEFH